MPNAIKYGRLLKNNVPNNHGTNKRTRFAYFLYDTTIDGNEISIKLTIRKSKQKNKIWVHGFDAIKKSAVLLLTPIMALKQVHQLADNKYYITNINASQVFFKM